MPGKQAQEKISAKEKKLEKDAADLAHKIVDRAIQERDQWDSPSFDPQSGTEAEILSMIDKTKAYQKCLLEKALPDPDLRYFSKSMAR